MLSYTNINEPYNCKTTTTLEKIIFELIFSLRRRHQQPRLRWVIDDGDQFIEYVWIFVAVVVRTQNETWEVPICLMKTKSYNRWLAFKEEGEADPSTGYF